MSDVLEVSDVLEKCLDDLEARIDDRQEEANRRQWRAFLDDEFDGDIFTPTRAPSPAGVDWPTVSVNDAQRRGEAMLVNEFRTISGVLANGTGQRLNVRCNYGTGILPSLFGCEMFFLDDDTNTLPTAKPFNDTDKIRKLIDAGVPDVCGGIGGKVFEMAGRFQEVFAARPRLARNVSLYHPDVQGPIDNAEVIWGSSMFYAFGDEPELMGEFLDLVTETYAAFMREWYRIVPQESEYSDHWYMMHKGRLMLRNDSLMNLSPEIYVEFVRPCDQRLFDEFGGAGGQHFCGRGDHFIEAMGEMRGLTALAMSQPELNDMETIYRNTVDKGIMLIGLARWAAEQADRPLHGRVHCL